MGILLIVFLSIQGHLLGAVELATMKAKINDQVISVQVAETEEERGRGLMFVRKMADDRGMLFVFGQEFLPTFWMKNTLIPLSIAFIDEKFRIVDIQEMTPPKSPMDLDVPRYTSRKPGTLALEMNREWFKRHGIKVGEELLLLGPAPTPRLRQLQQGTRPKSK